jgi:hypothetical protein
VPHDLASAGPGGSEADPKGHIIETLLKHLQHHFARDTLRATGLLENVPELAFE